MKPLRQPFVASLTIVALGLLAACDNSSGTSAEVADDCEPKFTFPTIEDGKVTIAAPDALPYYMREASGEAGIDADILNQFAADACLEANWVPTPTPAVIEAVSSGRADIAAGGWYATPERGEVVNQTNPVYVELPTILSTSPTTGIHDLAGKQVGTVTGYNWVPELKKLFGSKVKEYQSADATLQDLAAGRIDAALLGGIDAPYLVAQNPAYGEIVAKTMAPDPAISSSVNPSLPNYPHTKGNGELTAALNEHIKSLHESGMVTEILKRYRIDPALAEVEKHQ